MAPVEPHDPLARLGAATADIAPDDRLTDAVMEAVRAAPGDPIARIAAATRSLDVSTDLTDAVMARAVSAAPSWSDGVARSGPLAIGVAAVVAAAAALALFLSSTAEPDVASALSVGTVEVFE